MITAPITKFTLSDPQGVVLNSDEEKDITNDIGSWQDLELIYDRDDTSGVISEVSFPIAFHLDAMDIVKKMFAQNGLYAKAIFRIYKRADYSNDYSLVKEMELDFATYKETRNEITIEGVNSELAEYISSQGKTKYDIAVAEIAEPGKWNYERTEMLNRGSYTLVEGDDNRIEFDSENMDFWTLFINYNKAEMTPGSAEHEFPNQQTSRDTTGNYFFKAAAATTEAEKTTITTVYVDIDLEFRAGDSDIRVRFYRNGNATTTHWLIDESYQDGEYGKHIKERVEFKLYPGNTLSFVAQGYRVAYPKNYIYVKTSTTFNVEYYTKAPDACTIPVIRPETLLQKYLDCIAETPGTFSCEINWGSLYPVTPMICAAESIRNFEDAKLHGSLNDFMDWMHVLGYENDTEGRKLVYRPRDEFFRKDIEAIKIQNHELADLHTEASDEYAYTSIEIGYDKQDYESVNGRFEANGTFEYATGYVRRRESKLELVSPYRADSIGIELLCWERNKRSTDNKADNDIFFVALKKARTAYLTYMDTFLQEEGVKMFNAPYHPYFLALANRSLIGINAPKITFASTDMSNKTMISSGENLFADIVTGQKLFEPVVYNFASGNFVDLPDVNHRNGLVWFNWQGVWLKGFIKKIAKNYSLETETTWDLWKVK